MRSAIFVAFVLCCALGFAAENPGVVIKVSRRGIDLARRVAAEEVEKAVRKLKIKKLPVKGGSITNIQATSFSIGNTAAYSSSPNRFTLSISRARLNVKAKFRVSKRIIFKFTAKGTATVKAGSISIRQQFRLGRFSNGRPKLTAGSCSASIRKFDFKLKGNIFAKLINIVRGFFRNKIRKEIQKQICPSIRKFINDFNNKQLRRLNLNFPFAPGTKINLALVRSPAGSSSGLTAHVRGRCFQRSRSSPPSYPFSARRLSTFSSSKMAQISVSDYVLDTLLYAMHRNNVFRKSFSNSQVRNALSSLGPLSALLPSSLKSGRVTYSGSIYARSAPTSSFSNRGISVSGSFRLDLFAAKRRQRRRRIARINLRLNLSARFRISRGKIRASITRLTATVTNKKGMPASFFNTLINAAVRKTLLPALNAVGESGFELPSKFNYRFRRPTIRHRTGRLEIGSDFTHV